uniref:hypothetical protein n=1 Tax=Clostridium sp. 12(A) TaxID=1163671 RepID=UPI0004639479|nr:hypothetical protein [Clostridium sp. 12(A)]
MSDVEVWELLNKMSKENHRERMAKTPERIEYCIKQFEDNGIEYNLLNKEIGHFHCHRKSDGKLYQFWAGTGKIRGLESVRGIKELMRILLQ